MRRFGISLTLAATVACGLAILVLVPRAQSRQAPPVLQGAVLPAPPAPWFGLRDQFGRVVSPATLRGHPTIVTFTESHCKELCPLVAQKIRLAMDSLRASHAVISVVAISTDPEGDTPASVRQFSVRNRMWSRWHYLTGVRSTLERIWRAYYLYVPAAGSSQQLQGAHTSAIYLLDRRARERVLLANDPDLTTLTRDLRILSGLSPDSAGARVAAPRQGDLAPQFSLADIRGGNVSLGSLKGRVILINFWAISCPPCRQEMAMLSEANRRWSSRGLVVLGVNKGEDAGAVGRYLRSRKPSYRILLDQNGAVSSLYDVYALPWTLIVDQHGVVHSVHAGILDRNFLDRQVAPLLHSSA